MDFYERAGRVALGSRVRALADLLTREALHIYRDYGSELNPKWFPVFYALANTDLDSVTAIARDIGHSHVSVSKILGEMKKAGLVREKPDREDRRRTRVSLTKTGQRYAVNVAAQSADVLAAIESMSRRSTNDLWAALEEWETLLKTRPLRARVAERRLAPDVEIVPFEAEYARAFHDLNRRWITQYFALEEPDRAVLADPRGYILDRGGFIFVALLAGKPVGVCALVKRDDAFPYELAKMAVDPAAQGKHVGFLLGRRAVERAHALGADRVFLESNTKLVPAIRLYEKLGFVRIEGPPTPYARCDIQMELNLKELDSKEWWS